MLKTINSSLSDNNNINFDSYISHNHTIAASSNGTRFISEEGKIFTVGINNRLSLGHETPNKILYPPFEIKNLPPIKSISCSSDLTVLCSEEGEIYTFGFNEFGSLGINKIYQLMNYTYIPQKVNIPCFIRQVCCGEAFTICVSGDNELYSFGKNYWGTLGLGHFRDIISPAKIEQISNVEFVTCGFTHIYCKTDSAVYSWGCGSYGQLAHGNNTSKNPKPIIVNSLNNTMDIQCSSSFTLFLTSNGNVYGCGADYTKIGLCTLYNTPNSTLFSDLPVIKRMVCNSKTFALIDIENKLWVFGDNYCGQLGLGDHKNRKKPVLNEFIEDVIDIEVGGYNMFIRTSNNEIFATGDNTKSQLVLKKQEEGDNYISTPKQILQDNEDLWKLNIFKSRNKSARK